MLHPYTEVKFLNDDKGYGVIATKNIPKGTIIWVQDSLDRIFTPKQYDAFNPIYKKILDTYTFRNNKGNYVLCWDNGRFLNHSFKANCLSTAYDFEIAIKDIPAGQELTDDYGYLNISEPFKGIDEGTKRKYVYPDDLKKYYKTWDKQLVDAFKYIIDVPQNLKPILPNNTWKIASKIAQGQMEMKSILSLYYKE